MSKVKQFIVTLDDSEKISIDADEYRINWLAVEFFASHSNEDSAIVQLPTRHLVMILSLLSVDTIEPIYK